MSIIELHMENLKKFGTSPPQSPRNYNNFPNFMKTLNAHSEKDLILKSSFRINDSSKDVFHLFLLEKHIQLQSKQYGDYKIQYQFQNKFTIEGNLLQFSRDGDNQISFISLDNDIQIWRKQLSKRLVQKSKNHPFRAMKRISIRNLCAIYKGEQQVLDKGSIEVLAIKAFRKSSLSDGRIYQNFKNQIGIMKNIKHPNLGRLLNIYESDNSYYICMTHYDGGTLLDRSLKETFSIQSVHEIMKQLLNGLVYLHKNGITHRDIKPQNVIFYRNNSNDIAIIDFGLAISFIENQKLDHKCGTPGYVAPEIFKCSPTAPYNQKCDIFSSGVLFFWLLTKKLPYNAKNQQQLKIANFSFNFDCNNHPQLKHCSYETIDLLGKMLCNNPKNRISAKQAQQHPYFNSKKDIFLGSDKNFHYPYQIQESKFNI